MLCISVGDVVDNEYNCKGMVISKFGTRDQNTPIVLFGAGEPLMCETEYYTYKYGHVDVNDLFKKIGRAFVNK